MLTSHGIAMQDLLAGSEVGGVSESAMRRMCTDLASMTPPRYARAHRDARKGGWRVALIGPPVITAEAPHE